MAGIVRSSSGIAIPPWRRKRASSSWPRPTASSIAASPATASTSRGVRSRQGDRIETWGNSFALHRPVSSPCPPACFVLAGRSRFRGRGEAPEAAAQVEITAGGTTRQLWLAARRARARCRRSSDTKAGQARHLLRLRHASLGFLAAAGQVHARRESRRHGRRLLRQHGSSARRVARCRRRSGNLHE